MSFKINLGSPRVGEMWQSSFFNEPDYYVIITKVDIIEKCNPEVYFSHCSYDGRDLYSSGEMSQYGYFIRYYTKIKDPTTQ